MSGLALRDKDDVIHWAPFGDHQDNDMRRILWEGDINWGVMCEAYGEGAKNPRIVASVSIQRADVTCLLCLQCLDDLDLLD